MLLSDVRNISGTITPRHHRMKLPLFDPSSQEKLLNYAGHIQLILLEELSLEELQTVFTSLAKGMEKLLTSEISSVYINQLFGQNMVKALEKMLNVGSECIGAKPVEVVAKLQDVVIENLAKLSLSKNWYSHAKHTAIVIIRVFFERFSGFLNSFKFSILSIAYKHLKKLDDKYNSSVDHSNFKAGYINDWTALIDTVMTTSTTNVLDEKLMTRLLRLFKILTSQSSSNMEVAEKEGYNYPILSNIHATNFLSLVLKSDKFSHATGNANTFIDVLLARLDTKFDKLKECIVSNVADLLFFSYVKHSTFESVAFQRSLPILTQFQTQCSIVEPDFIERHFFPLWAGVVQSVFSDDYQHNIRTLSALREYYQSTLQQSGGDFSKMAILQKATTHASLYHENPFVVITLLELIQAALLDLGEFLVFQKTLDSDQEVAALVLEKVIPLTRSKHFYIRVVAVQTVCVVLRVKPIYNSILETGLNETNENFEVSHGNAYLMASVLATADVLDQDIPLRILSVVSKNLKGFSFEQGISNAHYEKQIFSWILLTGLFKYHSRQRSLVLENSQFMPIWRNLFALNQDSLKLVEIKNYALSSLLAYLDYETALTPELVRQLGQILHRAFMGLKVSTEGPYLLNRVAILKCFSRVVSSDFNSSILVSLVNGFSKQYKELENSLCHILNNYMSMSASAPVENLLVEYSTDLFAKTFPHLSEKIQLSVLENIISNIPEGKTVNISTALNKVTAKLSPAISSLILDIVSKESLLSEDTISINGATSGRCCVGMAKHDIASVVSRLTQSIVNETHPLKRSLNIAQLVAIHTSCMLTAGTSVVSCLVQLAESDPHPVVNSWCVNALADLKVSCTPCVVSLFTNDSFGTASSNTIFSNMYVRTGSAATRLLRVVLEQTQPVALQTILLASLDRCHLHFEKTSLELLEILPLLQVVNPKVVPLSLATKFMKYCITNTCVPGITKNELVLCPSDSPLFSNKTLFPFTYSEAVQTAAIKALSQMQQSSSHLWCILETCQSEKPIFELCLEKESLPVLLSLFSERRSTLFKPLRDLLMSRISNAGVLSRTEKPHSEEEDPDAAQLDREEDDPVAEEPVSWRFQLVVVRLVRRCEFQKNLLGDLIRLTFLCSSSNVPSLRLEGLGLLHSLLTSFASVKDPLSGQSVLEQQKAQIVSSVTRCFSPETSAPIVESGLQLSAELVPFGDQRIERTLTNALQDMNDRDFYVGSYHVTDLPAMRVAILAAWAKISPCSLTEKYHKVLLPLWVSTLREITVTRYGSEYHQSEISNRSANEYWLPIASAVSRHAEELESLLVDESDSFFFVLYVQLLEHKPSMEILKLAVHYPLACRVVFRDGVFEESVDIFERVALSGDKNSQTWLMEMCLVLLQGYFSSTESRTEAQLHDDVEKLFELFRLVTLVLTTNVPYLKEMEGSGKDDPLVKCAFSTLVQMSAMMPHLIQKDLYGCILFFFSRVIANDSKLLGTLVQPFKMALEQCMASGFSDLVAVFHSNISLDLSENSHFLIGLVLVTVGDVYVDLGSVITDCLKSSETVPLVMQSLNTMMGSESASCKRVLRNLIPLLVDNISEMEDPRLVVEVLYLLLKHQKSPENVLSVTSLLLDVILLLDESYRQYAHAKVMDVIRLDPAMFKEALVGLPDSEKIESLMRVKTEGVQRDHIQLKVFSGED